MDFKLTQDEMVALVIKAKNGDMSAFEPLLTTYEPVIYYNCFKILKDEHLAKDYTQETFIEILEKIKTLKEPSQFVRWAKTIAVHKCQDFLRKNKRFVYIEDTVQEDDEGERADPYEKYATLDRQTMPSEALDNEETRKMVLDLINQLPDNQRMCIVMYYYDEFSTAEIAEQLHENPNTVRTWMTRARRKLKAGFEEYEKNGTKLYSSSALLLLMYLRYFLQTEADKVSGAGIAASVIGGAAGTGTAVGASAGTAAGVTTGVAAASTGASASAGIFSSLAVKITAVVLGASVAVGGGIGISRAIRQRNNPPLVETVEVNSMPEIEESSEVIEEASETSEEVVHEHHYITAAQKLPSCTVDGYTKYRCSICGEEYTVTIAANGQHTYSHSSHEDPTCIKDGYDRYTCSKCGDSYDEPIPMISHAYEITEHVDPTCVDEGHDTYTCQMCGDQYTESIAVNPDNHNYEQTSYTAATCIAEGEETYTCSHCGNSYTNILPIDPNGHKWHMGTEGPIILQSGRIDENGEWYDVSPPYHQCVLCYRMYYLDTGLPVE